MFTDQDLSCGRKFLTMRSAFSKWDKNMKTMQAAKEAFRNTWSRLPFLCNYTVEISWRSLGYGLLLCRQMEIHLPQYYHKQAPSQLTIILDAIFGMHEGLCSRQCPTKVLSSKQNVRLSGRYSKHVVSSIKSLISLEVKGGKAGIGLMPFYGHGFCPCCLTPPTHWWGRGVRIHAERLTP